MIGFRGRTTLHCTPGVPSKSTCRSHGRSGVQSSRVALHNLISSGDWCEVVQTSGAEDVALKANWNPSVGDLVPFLPNGMFFQNSLRTSGSSLLFFGGTGD
jgi:hypothetical protein